MSIDNLHFNRIYWISRDPFPDLIGDRVKHLHLVNCLNNRLETRYITSHSYKEFDDNILEKSKKKYFPHLSFLNFSTYSYFRLRTKYYLKNSSPGYTIVRPQKMTEKMLDWGQLEFIALELLNPFSEENYQFLDENASRLDAVLIDTEVCREFIIDNFSISSERVLINRCGGLKLSDSSSANSTSRQWLYHGNFGKGKNVSAIFKVARTIPDNITVKIIGGTEERYESLKKKTSSVPSNLQFENRMSHGEILKEITKSELVVYVPENNRFNNKCISPVKVYESLLADTPVLTLDFPSLKEINQEVNCGLYMENSEAEVFRKAKELARKQHLLRKERERMQNEDKSHLTWKSRADQLLKQLKSLE